MPPRPANKNLQSETTPLKKLLIALAVVVAVAVGVFALQKRMDGTIGATLTKEEIASLSDFELVRRVRIDLIARISSQDYKEESLHPDLLPVFRTGSFEDARSAIGTIAAIPSESALNNLVADYTTLGAVPVADVIQHITPGKPIHADRERQLAKALAAAKLDQLRATWVRNHADSFAVR